MLGLLDLYGLVACFAFDCLFSCFVLFVWLCLSLLRLLALPGCPMLLLPRGPALPSADRLVFTKPPIFQLMFVCLFVSLSAGLSAQIKLQKKLNFKKSEERI